MSKFRSNQQKIEFIVKYWRFDIPLIFNGWRFDASTRQFNNIAKFPGKMVLNGGYLFNFGSPLVSISLAGATENAPIEAGYNFYPILEDFNIDIQSPLVVGDLIAYKKIIENFLLLPGISTTFTFWISAIFELIVDTKLECYGLKAEPIFINGSFSASDFAGTTPFYRDIKNVE